MTYVLVVRPPSSLKVAADAAAERSTVDAPPLSELSPEGQDGLDVWSLAWGADGLWQHSDEAPSDQDAQSGDLGESHAPELAITDVPNLIREGACFNLHKD